jgi:glycosyltransferase involved in cell wall biosynthesis
MTTIVVDASKASALPAAEPRAIELTILMPCLNEAETIAACVKNARTYLERSGIRGEILVADNGSTDGSQALATENGARVVPVASQGYGAALLGGIEAARGTYVIMGDADDSYDFTNLDPFVAKLREGYDLVMGNRFKGGIERGAMPLLHRYLGNPVLTAIGQLFFKIPVGDFHCGLRGFRTESIRRLGLITAGMEFASEMVVRAALERYRIAEVPTTLRPDGRSRPPHLKTWRDGWRHLKFLLMYSPKWLFLYPSVVLLGVGAALALLLLYGRVQVETGLALDINTFVAACFLVISGVQVLSFGVLARHYASITGMLPGGRRSAWLLKYGTTDNMVLVAAVLLIAGLATFGFAALAWAKVGFGEVTDPMTPRAVVAGLSLVVIAIQIGFQAFLIGILQIPLMRAPSAGEATKANRQVVDAEIG